MNSIDYELGKREEERQPIRVGMIGAGATGRAIALQLATPPRGIRLVAIANRTISNAERTLREAGMEEWKFVTKADQADQCVRNGEVVITEQPEVVTRCDAVDVVVEVTGTIEPAARVILDAIEHGKHVVMVNAELDSLLGPILKVKAERAGVVLTNTDGEEPGVAMTLNRYLGTLGLKVVAGGNIKGMVDYYRNPDTQAEFARKNGQDVRKVTSFADATKLSMESTVLANATGFRVAKRGMHGPACAHVRELPEHLPQELLISHGLVDYVVGAEPHTGAFVVVREENPLKMAQFAYYKMGSGPFYVFYTPFHLPHLQIVSTIARAAVHRDPTVSPLAGPVCDVVAVAKRDLRAGETMDGVGGFCAYGLIDNHAEARGHRALPISISEGCTLTKSVFKDEVVSFDDVDFQVADLIGSLWKEQLERWPVREAEPALI